MAKETDENMTEDTAEHNMKASGPDLRALPMTIHAQYLKDISFENPNAPASLMTLNTPPAISIDVDINTKPIEKAGDTELSNTFEVSLTIRAEAKSEEAIAFIAEMTYAGVFTLGDIPDEAKRPVLLVECPRIMFPFARAILGEMTRDGGFPPLMINPIDFADLYNKKFGAFSSSPGDDDVAGHA